LPTSKYTIRLEEKPRKELAKFDENSRLRIARAINLLASNPHPPKAKRVVGFNYWRIRIGDYRIIYEILNDELVIVVVRLGHRRNVYKRLPPV